MKRRLAALLVLLAFARPLLAAEDSPAHTPAAQPPAAQPPAAQPPKGDVIQGAFKTSQIFPGTERDYWIYVPRQYDPAKPACLYVNQDGIQFHAPEVFDQLIHKGEMPVTIGVFVTPGRVPALTPAALDRFNRSYEYDGLGDAYARFLLDELLPEVEKRKTPDGREILLSKNGNDRAIGGASSGAICAFTAAWERPDAFSRVFSAIGTYVGLRGGNEYPTLIRKVEPKPLRIFLQDGSSDQNIYGGDWWMANQEMERALTFAGYEVKHAWGDGGHNGEHATKIFPDAMRWLWKDWPAPIKAGGGSPQLKEIVVAGEGWKPVEGEYKSARALAVNAKGEVYFCDRQRPKNWLIGREGRAAVDREIPGLVCSQAIGPNGKLVAAIGEHPEFGENPKALISFTPAGDRTNTIAENLRATQIVVLHSGGIYTASWSNPQPGTELLTGVCYCSPSGETVMKLDEIDWLPGGIACSPDQSLLYVSDRASHWVHSYQIQVPWRLAHKQRYYHLHVPDTAENAGAGGLRVDHDGRLYVATLLGIQICDQAGRVNCILPTPAPATEIEFGDANFDTLFVVCGKRIYQRKLKVRGAPAFEPPHKPAAPRL